MDILDRLLRILTGEGTLAERGADGRLLITHFHGRALEPPAALIIDPEDLQSCLDDTARGGPRHIWGEVDAATEAWYLLLNHFDEEIDRYDRKIVSLEITPRGVRGTPRSDWTSVITTDLDPADGEWFAEHPGRRPTGR